MRTHRYFWALAVALLASCADYSVPDEVLYGEAVYTQAQPNYDFKPLTYYYLDTTAKVYEDVNSFTTLDIGAGVYKPIGDAIRANMEALGYLPASARPVGATPATVMLQMVVLKGSGQVWYPGYWCDPYYYGWCYYDWYYAGSYKYGTVMLAMGDASAALGDPLDLVWISAMYGVASTPSYDIPRVVDAVNRSFGQSGYLDTH